MRGFRKVFLIIPSLFTLLCCVMAGCAASRKPDAFVKSGTWAMLQGPHTSPPSHTTLSLSFVPFPDSRKKSLVPSTAAIPIKTLSTSPQSLHSSPDEVGLASSTVMDSRSMAPSLGAPEAFAPTGSSNSPFVASAQNLGEGDLSNALANPIPSAGNNAFNLNSGGMLVPRNAKLSQPGPGVSSGAAPQGNASPATASSSSTPRLTSNDPQPNPSFASEGSQTHSVSKNAPKSSNGSQDIDQEGIKKTSAPVVLGNSPLGSGQTEAHPLSYQGQGSGLPGGLPQSPAANAKPLVKVALDGTIEASSNIGTVGTDATQKVLGMAVMGLQFDGENMSGDLNFLDTERDHLAATASVVLRGSGSYPTKPCTSECEGRIVRVFDLGMVAKPELDDPKKIPDFFLNLAMKGELDPQMVSQISYQDAIVQSGGKVVLPALPFERGRMYLIMFSNDKDVKPVSSWTQVSLSNPKSWEETQKFLGSNQAWMIRAMRAVPLSFEIPHFDLPRSSFF